tara:strand:+ start:186 stop:719 length:534 start_codon:yes stop_codon:yes gene_type:complete
MNYQEMKEVRNRNNRPQKISTTLNDVTKNIINKFNKREYVIHSKWEEMVGSFFAKYTDPIKIENIRDNEQIENQNFSLGILHININRSAALEFQHLKDKIIEKINSYFGYKAISKIVLHQVANLEKKQKKVRKVGIEKKLDPEKEKKIKITTMGIKNKNLEKTLFRLGKSILIDKDS